MSNEIKTRSLTPTEQKYTYAQSMQLEGQTGTIGHLRGDFATTGYGDQVISALKGRKALLGFVPSLELFVKAFDQIVGNIVLKALNAYVPGTVKNRLDRNIVGRITVGNNRSGRAELNGFAEQRDSLR